MQPFDHLAVLVSVLFGLGLARLMTGAADAAVGEARALEPLPLVWTIDLFLFQVVLWWLLFQRAGQPSWTFVHFLVLLGYPVLVYALCAVLFPRDAPPDSATTENFLDRRVWFFGIWIIVYLLGPLETAVATRAIVTGTVNLLALVLALAMHGIALWTRNRVFHWVFAVLVLLLHLQIAVSAMPAIE